MSKRNTARAWTDASSRHELSEQEREAIAPHPAGLIELTDDELDGYSGAAVNPTIRWGHYWPGCG